MKTLPNYPLCLVLWLIDRWAFGHGPHGRPQYGRVRSLSPRLIIKSGILEGTNEAEVIRYVKKRTTIPLPQIVASATGVFDHFMVMKAIPGDPLDSVWPKMTEMQQASVIRQLRGIIAQLRALPPPNPHAISGLYGRKCKDARVATMVPFGPFKNESEFNDFLVKHAQGNFPPDPFLDETRRLMCDNHRIVFTHGDFAPRNIMVQGDVVVGLIDWEHSGWYPEHWEYCKAHFSPDLNCGKSWIRALDEIMPYGYAHDLRIEKRLSDLIVGPT
ncbi:kinase-like protein [Mycena alexandri]|uniref:Kinase-like protein n=1 Tax=Mycena alexandri TaxID=1745969 RepID=A0AAD6WY63_9AGAR|nr:kinase-like protein [Mycena alexandri]